MIKAMPKELASKIAAGEVVERPLSIVKELIENSVDAGSDSITVEIKKGGKEYIRVSDNGAGIPKDELRLAFKRYATSKIYTEDDLENICSLGFRGEALSSVAAVSRTEFISKTKDAAAGARIAFEGGEETALSDSACEEGTTVIVKDLFYNLPARKKFLKADNTESSLIADYVSKMAMAYPGIKFRFINNGNILFSTRGTGSLYDVIINLYSPQTARTLVNVNYGEGEMSLYGYVSMPDASKTNRRSQVFFVNGRWVKSKVLDSALEAAYSDKMFEGHYPVSYLFLSLDPSELDVNVHPRKMEIKFYNEPAVKDFVASAIRRALYNKDAAPDIARIGEGKLNELREEICQFYSEKKPEIDAELLNFKPKDKVDDNIFLSINNEDSLFKSIREEQQKLEIPTLTVDDSLRKTLGKEKKFCFSELKPIGQIFTTYIMATDSQNLYIIDQHAAHERIMYEHLLYKFNSEDKLSQVLLAPVLIKTTPAQTAASESWLKLLDDIGFVIENFGPNQFVIKQIPAALKLEEAESFVNSVLESDIDNPDRLQEKKDAIIMASCKAAVKSGDKLSTEEIIRLFEDLDKCENPFSCPHGRPTFLRFSEGQIEHFFKRK